MKTKQEKALALLEAFEQVDEGLVQRAMNVDDPSSFLALRKPSVLKRWGALAACLVLVLAVAAFPWMLSQLPHTPATEPTHTTLPTEPTDPPTYPAEDIAALVIRLQDAGSAADTNYTQALAHVTDDFNARPEGTASPAFTELAEQMAATRDARITALSAMVETLEAMDLKDTAAVAAKVTEAEALLRDCTHDYGQRIRHSNSPEGTPCPDVEFYQLCAKCNALLLSRESHIEYYSQSEDGHQLCCRVCDTTQPKAPHTPNAQGKCEDCDYVVNAKILIIESIVGESQSLCAMIDSRHSFTVVNVTDRINMPKTPEELQAYHEVILVNIANSDMPTGFASLLHNYVRNLGGGLLTIGGNTADSTPDAWKPHAYDKTDLAGTLYQEMLPVEIQGKPSVAVVFIIDSSGSMYLRENGEVFEQSKLYAAIAGAEACLYELSEDDYVGILPMNDYAEDFALIPRPQYQKIMDALDSLALCQGGGTIFCGALDAARHKLLAQKDVEKRHIVIITDGIPGDPREMYLEQARMNAQAGITMSVVGIGCDNTAKKNMTELVEAGGSDQKHFYDASGLDNTVRLAREALRYDDLTENTYKDFVPTVTAGNLFPNLDPAQLPTFGGAYRSKRKEGATEILSSPYGPLYAQWAYGKGTVGSFMCDLNGTWSKSFIDSESGREILNALIALLANPSENTA